MKQTTGYNLYITDDSTESVLNWRTKMNGKTDSNMVKIDNALGQKADDCSTVNATLRASAWAGYDPPYTQELSVPGLGALQNGTISLSHYATEAQREAARIAMLSIIGQEQGKLIIAADGELPEFDLPVSVILLG